MERKGVKTSQEKKAKGKDAYTNGGKANKEKESGCDKEKRVKNVRVWNPGVNSKRR